MNVSLNDDSKFAVSVTVSTNSCVSVCIIPLTH